MTKLITDVNPKPKNNIPKENLLRMDNDFQKPINFFREALIDFKSVNS
jgi:hypothetical protein